MITILIIGIVLAIALPSWQEFSEDQRFTERFSAETYGDCTTGHPIKRGTLHLVCPDDNLESALDALRQVDSNIARFVVTVLHGNEYMVEPTTSEAIVEVGRYLVDFDKQEGTGYSYEKIER